METQTQTVVHIICGRCYLTKPNLREPIPLLMPYCQRFNCCYCHETVAYEGVFYRDEPRERCVCGGVVRALVEQAEKYAAAMALYISQGHRVDGYILVEDHRGRGAHLYPIDMPTMTDAQRKAWMKERGFWEYTGFPSPEQKP